MEKEKPFAIDWEKIKDGTMLSMKDFPTIKLLKLDNKKACYFGYDSDSGTIVDIDEYVSELHGGYHYFQATKDDWHPLTSRLWNV